MKVLIFTLISFITLSCASHRPLIIAHREASGYLPEHTLPSLALAHSWNIDFIEPDIVLTKDNVPVVLHDIHLDTTNNVAQKYPNKKRKDGRFYAIDFTLKQMKSLSVHERMDLTAEKRIFPHRFPLSPIDFKVPTLEEYILLVQGMNKTRHQKIGLIPEIKSPAFHKSEGKDITKIVFKILKKYGLDTKREDFYLQCFDPKELKRIRYQLKSDINLVQLIGDNSWKEADCDYQSMITPHGIREIAKYAQVISPWMDPFLKNKSLKYFVDFSHKNDLKVIVYTFRIDDLPQGYNDAKKLYEDLIDSNVDGIFTDFADLPFL